MTKTQKQKFNDTSNMLMFGNLVSVQPRRHGKLTGITKPMTISPPDFMMFAIIGFLAGIFTVIAILRPDLINWQVFSQSFMMGMMMGRFY